jgi:hypothetical protein
VRADAGGMPTVVDVAVDGRLLASTDASAAPDLRSLALASCSRGIAPAQGGPAQIESVPVNDPGGHEVARVVALGPLDGAALAALRRRLALGAGLALAATRVAQVPAQARLVAGWLGLAAVGGAGVLLDTATPFPGYAALLPTVGAALVIGAGIAREQRRFEARRVLSLRPLRYVGDRSYAFYLWHWPVLILAIEHEGHDFSVGVKLLLLAGAFTLSIVSYALWEDPIRRLRWPARTGGLLWPASAVVVLAVALPILGSLDKAAARVDAASAAVKPAALVDVSATYTPQAELQAVAAVRAAVRAARRNRPLPSKMTPPVGRLRGDFYELPNECTPGRKDTQPKKICRLGAKKSSKKIVVIGDSHAQMWMRPIVQMAKKDRWVVIPLIKVSCIPRTWKSNGVCGGWLQWAKKKASRMHPGVTLVIGSWMATYGPDRAIRPVDSLTSAMLRSSASVVVLGDLPGQTRDPTDCLLARGSTMRTCSTETKPVQLRVNRAIAANTRRRAAGFIDPLRWFCGHTRGGGNLLCPLVVNKTITCVDRGHISKTYAGELNAAFRSAFRRELFR